MTSFRAREPVSGYTHLAGLVIGLAGSLVLLLDRREDGMLLPNIAYAASLVGLYAASSAYHLTPGSERVTRGLRKIDHSAIFLFIAGSCTPVFWRAFEGATRGWMLGGIWAVALVGIALRVTWMHAPRALYTLMYIGMGWFVVVEAGTVFRALSGLALSLVVAGGIVYTIGALVYATKRPDPWPRVFGFHEIWHLFVLAGSALHYAAIFVLR